jgi:hypothetical protein
MAAPLTLGHDARMDIELARPDHGHHLAASAHQLQRAAGTLQKHAASPDAVPTLAATLAHVEESVDRLAVAMEQMANAVTDWCVEPGSVADETALPPEARALRWHLQSVADELRAAEDACGASRDWTHRLLGDVADTVDDADDSAATTNGAQARLP